MTSRPARWALGFTLLLMCIALSCGNEHDVHIKDEILARPVGAVVEIKAPLGLPPVPIPQDNPPTADTIALGKKLFFETRVSADAKISCATCHRPDRAFTDGLPVSVGEGGQRGPRNAPTLLNAAYSPTLFWDGRAPSLEKQAGMPIANQIEMNQPHAVLVTTLAGDAEYRALFAKAFGTGTVTIDMVEMALASYERTLLSGDSAFDRYQYGGDKNAMTAPAIRGLAIFKDKDRGNCVTCHSIGDHDALFSDGKFHNIGVGVNSEGELTDLGRYEVTKLDADKGAFRTPTLRNIAKTAPYMHDGSKKTLKEVIDFYVGGGTSNPQLDKEIKELKLSAQDKADLLEFLQSLTGSHDGT